MWQIWRELQRERKREGVASGQVLARCMHLWKLWIKLIAALAGTGTQDARGANNYLGGQAMLTVEVEEYIAWKQPRVLELIWTIWPPIEEELTPEQKRLEKLMKQRPRPGLGGGGWVDNRETAEK
jgi:hypothetical protein